MVEVDSDHLSRLVIERKKRVLKRRADAGSDSTLTRASATDQGPSLSGTSDSTDYEVETVRSIRHINGRIKNTRIKPETDTTEPWTNRPIEAALIAMPSAELIRRALEDEKNDVILLVGWLVLSGLGLWRVQRVFSLPQDLYLWLLPIIITLVSTTSDRDTLLINVILSLCAFMGASAPFQFAFCIYAWMSDVQPSDPIILAAYAAPELQSNIYAVLSMLCGESLSLRETSLFASLLVNVACLTPKSITTSCLQGVLFCPFLALVPCLPLFNKVIELSRIVGPHRRPANAAALKQKYALYIYLAVPILSLALLCGHLYVDGYNIWQLVAYIAVNDSEWSYGRAVASTDLVHLKMLAYWSTILAVVLPLVLVFSPGWQLDLRRKVWHICVVVMFLLVGPNCDAAFTGLAMAICLELFLLLEVVRATTLPPFGATLHSVLSSYTDHRDVTGPVIISHIFLLLGIGLPIMLEGSAVGIVCLGLGDSAASTIGRRFGRHRIFGHKTVEGTAAFIVGASCGMLAINHLPGYNEYLTAGEILSMAFSAALLEATSAMNDNVLVPLYMLMVWSTLRT